MHGALLGAVVVAIHGGPLACLMLALYGALSGSSACGGRVIGCGLPLHSVLFAAAHNKWVGVYALL